MATAVSSVPMGDKTANYISKNRKMLINGQVGGSRLRQDIPYV